jgi:hypothetical protein
MNTGRTNSSKDRWGRTIRSRTYAEVIIRGEEIVLTQMNCRAVIQRLRPQSLNRRRFACAHPLYIDSSIGPWVEVLDALVVVAEGLDLLLVGAGGDIGDEGGRATGHLNSQFMIDLQKHDRVDISKREGGQISKN